MWDRYRKCDRLVVEDMNRKKLAFREFNKLKYSELDLIPSISGPFFWGTNKSIEFATFEIGFEDVLVIEFSRETPSKIINACFFNRKGKGYDTAARFWSKFLKQRRKAE